MNQSSRSRSHRRSKSRRAEGLGSGSRGSKRRDRIRRFKQFFWFGLYGAVLLLSVRKMMHEQLTESFWLNLSAFALLWVFRALSSAQKSSVLRVKSSWFFIHLAVVLAHFAVMVFFDEPSPSALIEAGQVHKEPPSQPVVVPWEPSGE